MGVSLIAWDYLGKPLQGKGGTHGGGDSEGCIG